MMAHRDEGPKEEPLWLLGLVLVLMVTALLGVYLVAWSVMGQ